MPLSNYNPSSIGSSRPAASKRSISWIGARQNYTVQQPIGSREPARLITCWSIKRSGKHTWMSYYVNMGVSTSLFPCSRHCGDEESRLIRDVLTVLPLIHSDQADRHDWKYQVEIIVPLPLARQKQAR